MPDVLLQINSAGLDTGPFDITDNLGNTLATGVTRADLIAGITLFGVDSAVNLITATSTGVCKNAVSALVDFGGGGGGVTCSFVRLSLIPTGNCKIYQLSVQEGTGSAQFSTRLCGADDFSTITLNEGQTVSSCYAQAPTVVTGSGNVVMGANCGSTSPTSYLVNYVLCDGTAAYATLNNQLTEVTVCIQDGTAVYPPEVEMTIIGACQ